MKFRYLIIGGNPFIGYTRTTSITSLNIVGKTNDLEEARRFKKELYDECGGIMILIDTEIGKEVENE